VFLERAGIGEGFYLEQLAAAKDQAQKFLWMAALPAFAWGETGKTLPGKLQSARAAARKYLGKENHGTQLDWPTAGWDDEEMWRYPVNTPVSKHALYKTGCLLGIDAASIAAVNALHIEPGMDVLDLCCAPGAKLAVMADRMQRKGRLVGFDVSKRRIGYCVGLSRSRRLGAPWPFSEEEEDDAWRFELFRGDATKIFDENFESELVWSDEHDQELLDTNAEPDTYDLGDGTFVQLQKLKGKSLNFLDEPAPLERESFDRVLVDAECTNDGAMHRILRHLNEGSENFSPEKLDRLFEKWNENSKRLESLQRGLIQTGFYALRPGGKMVYSTCSFSPNQNEAIAGWLLEKNSDAEPLPPLDQVGARMQQYWSPTNSRTSGLFVQVLSKS